MPDWISPKVPDELSTRRFEARVTSLAAAAHVFADAAPVTGAQVTRMATTFEAWLLRPVEGKDS